MKFWIGIILIFFGAFFLLDNLNYFEISLREYFVIYWPSLFILWGVKKILASSIYFCMSVIKHRPLLRFQESFFWGSIILAFGLIVQGHNLEWFTLTWSLFWSWFWPLLIIYIGINITFKNAKKKFLPKASKKSIIGSMNIGGSSWEVEDQIFQYVVSDISLDLSSAILKEGETELQFQCVVGDISIMVPHDIPIKVKSNVKVGSTNIFGNNYDGIWRTASYIDEGYSEAERNIYIDASLSIGEVIIKRVD